ncbi:MULTISPECIES: putative quinol monooxygenase [Caldilinea]|uniref:putative quinol monooxygenase n=1 Tax=Caldilinea TaxID=233191 RepID=UPI000A002B9B
MLAAVLNASLQQGGKIYACRILQSEVQARQGRRLRTAFEAVVAPSRTVEGVLHFDIAQDITDPNSFIATEVFVDKVALARQPTARHSGR